MCTYTRRVFEQHYDGSVTAIYDRHSYLEEKTHALQMWADKIARLTGDTPDNVESLAEAKAKVRV